MMRKLIFILLLTLMSAVICNCKSIKTIEVEKPIYCCDTIETLTAIYDSIYVDHYREVHTKADTVRITDSIVILRYKLEKDTVYRNIEKPIEITKKVLVDKDHSGIEKFLMIFGVLALLVILCVMLYYLYRKIR